MLTCTCICIHPWRAKPASPVELATSRRSCATSLDTFTQSCLHRAWPKTRGSESGSRSALIVVAHVFSWPPASLRHVRGGVGRRRSLISSPSGRLAACPNQRSLLCTSSAGMPVRQRRRRSSADSTQSLPMTYRMWRMRYCQTPPASFRRLLVLTMSQNRRTKSSVPLPDRPCPLYKTIFHTTTKDITADKRMRNVQDESCYRSLRCLDRLRRTLSVEVNLSLIEIINLAH